MQGDPKIPMEQVVREDGRYPAQAYALLNEALVRAVKEIHGDQAPGDLKHVSGAQLCLALKQLAQERWGMLAKTVLGKWNIRSTLDFGNMVYLLISHKYMGKAEEDSIEHFRDVFSFDDAFGESGALEMKE